MKLYGVTVSYFTGKIETYLRYKGIAYDWDQPFGDRERIMKLAGAMQVPLIELDDGRWLQDSTPMIRYFEKEHPDRPVLPQDPVVRFIALLIEDYADEWLWRSAMHYRWSFPRGRALLGRILVEEITGHMKFLPASLRRLIMRTRQRVGYVVNDGVTRETVAHVEQGYHNALANMTRLLEDNPYLLGKTPSVADIGLMGPMLRHFSQDPDPAQIMRYEAPAVFEWVARTWNAGATTGATEFNWSIPDSAQPMLQEIAETHLVQLRENAAAFHRGESLFEMTVQGCHYRKITVSQYRVYCLERLREEFDLLDEQAKAAVKALLAYPGSELLWDRSQAADSGHDVERLAPFNKGINVYTIDAKKARL